MSSTDDFTLPAGGTFRKAIEALAATLAEFPIRYAIIGGLQ